MIALLYNGKEKEDVMKKYYFAYSANNYKIHVFSENSARDSFIAETNDTTEKTNVNCSLLADTLAAIKAAYGKDQIVQVETHKRHGNRITCNHKYKTGGISNMVAIVMPCNV